MKIFAFANFVLLVTLALSMFAGKSLKSDNINAYHNSSITGPTDRFKYETKLFLFEGFTNAACVDPDGCACEKDGECIIAYKECKSLKEKYPKTTEWC